MPLLLWQAFSWMQTGWVAWLLPLIKKIPWQVWAGIAGMIAVLYYGHVREARGYEKCHVEVKKATDAEISRQAQVSSKVLKESQDRASKAEAKQLEATNEAAKLQGDVDKLKTAKVICLPGSITKRYRP